MKNTEKPGRNEREDLPKADRSRRIKPVRIILILIFTAGLVLSGLSLAQYYGASGSTESGIDELKNELPEATPRPSPAPPTESACEPEPESSPEPEPEPTERIYEVSTRFKRIYAHNTELVGWITIDGTQIDYPVMQSVEDEEFYLSHNFDKESDAYGLPFLDARCEIAPKNQVQIVYGHNIKSGIMFHDLTLYEDEEFWREHQYIVYDTIYDEAVYQIVAAFVYNASRSYPGGFQFNRYIQFSAKNSFTELSAERNFDDYKEQILELALYETGLDFGIDDQYLIVATCEYSAKNGRFVLLAKQVS